MRLWHSGRYLNSKTTACGATAIWRRLWVYPAHNTTSIYSGLTVDLGYWRHWVPLLRRSFQSIPHVVHVKLSAGPRASYGHLIEIITSVFSRARQKCARIAQYGGGHTYFSSPSSQKRVWQDLQQDNHMSGRGESKCNLELYQKIGEPTGICV